MKIIKQFNFKIRIYKVLKQNMKKECY